MTRIKLIKHSWLGLIFLLGSHVAVADDEIYNTPDQTSYPDPSTVESSQQPVDMEPTQNEPYENNTPDMGQEPITDNSMDTNSTE